MRFRLPIVLGLGFAGAIAVLFDVPVSQFFKSDPLPGELRSLVHKTEFFGHAYGVLGIAFTIYLLNEIRRRQLFRLVATTFAAGLACDAVKLMVYRVRPTDFSFEVGQPTFLGLSFLQPDSWVEKFDSSFQSFPSAHTGTAIAFALALGWMYPRASKWFLTLGVLVAVSRIDGMAHFLSDTIVGGAVGYIVAFCFLGNTRLGGWFDNFERQLNQAADEELPVKIHREELNSQSKRVA